MKKITLRPLESSDYDAVTALWTAAEGLHLAESDTRPAIELFLRRNPGLSHVATLATGEIVAAVLCGHDGRRGYLHHLAVAAAHRKRGIARRLVTRCLALLRTQGITRCNIFLLADNEAGKTFWLHEGWQPRTDVLLVQKLLDPAATD